MTRPRGARAERGMSMSTFVATVVVALLMMGGLAIDGGALSHATRQCHQVAAEAARAATDAGAARRAAGLPPDPDELRRTARRVIDNSPGIDGEVRLDGDLITITTHRTVETTFLSLVRVTSLPAHGQASAVLRGSP